MPRNQTRAMKFFGPALSADELEAKASCLLADMQALQAAKQDRLTLDEQRLRAKLRYRARRLGYRLLALRRRYWLQHIDSNTVVLKDCGIEEVNKYLGERWQRWAPWQS